MCEEFGIDGESGIAHKVWFRREWSFRFSKMAVGEGECELSFISENMLAASSMMSGIDPALSAGLPMVENVNVAHTIRRMRRVVVKKKKEQDHSAL